MKNNEIQKIIDDLLTEVSLDPRVETGIFEIYNCDHLDVLAEHMESRGIDSEVIAEFIESLAMDEGKYPERQAYNREGWLVTFPSKEYRDAAIKKGTHSASDPTHGKGGMNLYYKRKGKQKRQKQQTLTKVEPAEKPTTKVSAPAAVKVTQPSKVAPSQDKAGPAASKATTAKEPEEYWDDTSASAAQSDRDLINQAFGFDKETPKPEKPATAAPAPKAEPVLAQPAQPSADIAKIEKSKEFATKKGWALTPYGEYRDGEGNPVAVVGLSGEVVPIRTNDREEYKLFAEKNPN